MPSTLHGFPVSPYVRAVRIVLAEKGIAHDYRAIGFDDLKTDDYARLNPFRKMPVLVEEDGFVIYETPAILRYLDETGGGAPLTPATPRDRATMTRWIGIASSYLYPAGVGGLVVQRVMVPSMGGTADEAVVASSSDAFARHLDVLETELDGAFLLGGGFTLADALVGATLDLVSVAPEGAGAIAARPATAAYLGGLRARESFRATYPAMLAGG